MTVTDLVLSLIQNNFVEVPGYLQLHRSNTRNISRSCRVQNWWQEDVFEKEPVRRMIIAMSINQSCLGTNRTNLFHCQKFGLNEIFLYRNGLHNAGTPVSTSDNKRIYYNTLEALDFVLNTSHGISLAKYDNHYIMAFDLTSTEGASHDFVHPELINCTIYFD